MSVDLPIRRRWFQFSLRTLLVLMVVASLGMGWLMKERRRIAERREAMAMAGFKSIRLPIRQDWERELLFGDDWPAYVWGIGGLHFEDNDLALLKGLKQLKCLICTYEITDVGLSHLEGLAQLQSLNLYKTQVTDSGLVHLKGLTQLQSLMLTETHVTDAGLVHLKGLAQLQELSLSGPQITDTGLAHFKGLVQLQVLSLFGTAVTDAGVADLQAALPNCKITRTNDR